MATRSSSRPAARVSRAISPSSASGSNRTSSVAVRSGITVTDGVLVDEYCRTNHPECLRRRRRGQPLPPAVRRDPTRRAFRQRQPACRRGREQHARQGNRIRRPALVLVRPVRPEHPTRWPRARIGTRWWSGAHVDDFDFCAFYLRDGLIRGVFGVERGDEVLPPRSSSPERQRWTRDSWPTTDSDLVALAEAYAEVAVHEGQFHRRAMGRLGELPHAGTAQPRR